MHDRQEASGPQFRGDRPPEQEAVRTTIVGGRPPGSGQGIGNIPRGIEVLVKKASVDPQFRQVLLDRRAEAAGQIGLTLDPAEVMMLNAVPAEQLELIIARTTVPGKDRRAFLGTAAGAMLAALGLVATGCVPVTGIAPDPPPSPDGQGEEGQPQDETSGGPETTGEPPAEPSGGQPGPGEDPIPGDDGQDRIPVIEGIRPDRIPVPEGMRPDRIPVPEGIRPDRVPPPPEAEP